MSDPQPDRVGSVRTQVHPLWKTPPRSRGAQPLPGQDREAGEADTIFETLMGDVVEPRREFIQDNTLKVVNLDV